MSIPLNISRALRNLFADVNAGRGPIEGKDKDYELGWAPYVKGQAPVPVIAAFHPAWPLAAGAAYPAQPTAEQLAAAILTAAKAAKIDALNKALAQPVTVSGITLAVDADTQTQLNHLVTMLQLAYSQEPEANQPAFLAANISAITGPLVDHAGASHDMTVSQALQLVLLYAQAYGAARAANLANVAAVNAATTVEAVEAVGQPVPAPNQTPAP